MDLSAAEWIWTYLREWKRCVDTHENRKPYKKCTFLMEKCFEDLRQDEKHVPDLLEAIIQLPGPVKEELRPILSKISKFRPDITKIRV